VKLFGLRLTTLLGFYRARVRRHPVQELLSGAGIAVGVALLFAVGVANTSITGSADEIVHGLVGDARLQLSARSAAGFSEDLAARAGRLPGVERAVPLLRARATLVGPRARHDVELVGATPALAKLGGSLTENFGSRGLRMTGGLALTARVAEAIGAKPDREVGLLVRGAATRVHVAAVLQSDSIGPLAGSRAVVAPLRFVQRVSRRARRVSNVLVVPRRGQGVRVRRELERLAGGRLAVGPADTELELLRQAAKPNDQSTGLFAAIAAMVGFLFALNAMLLTSSERRRFVADLRIQGFDHRQVLLILTFEGLALGGVACVVGLALGDVLSRLVFHEIPEYLAFAFPVGAERVVEPSNVVRAFAAGLAAALIASLRPMLDFRRGRSIPAVFEESGAGAEGIASRATVAALLVAATLIAGTSVMLLIAPDTTLVGGVLLAIATPLVTPAVFSIVVHYVGRVAQRSHRTYLLSIATRELAETRTRSMVVAAVGALAVYGTVSIEGTHADLLRGLDRATADHWGTADLWVTTGTAGLTTESFPARREIAAIGAVPQIASVRPYRSALLDADGRRLWVIARPPDEREMLPRSQLIEGEHALATRRLRGGGWGAVSNNLAESRRAGVGDRFELPSPSGGFAFRVAAITTNIGWGPGAVILNGNDYARAWGSGDPAALEVDTVAGVAPAAGKRAVSDRLGPGSGLKVETKAEHQRRYYELGRQGLARLTQISTLLSIAAALAMASAIATAIWHRRRRLASLKVQGFDHRQLWRSLLHETGIVVAVGCGVGSVMGLFGHVFASRYLELTTGYPAPFSADVARILLAVAVVAGTAYVVAAVPGYLAARVPEHAAFQD
jgi:putative ABC transport system permease protein